MSRLSSHQLPGPFGRARTLAIRVCLFLLGSLLLSGCVTVEFGSAFEEDGAATHSIEIVFPQQRTTQKEFTRALAQLNQLIKEAEDAGLTVDRIDREDETVVRITNEVEDSTDTGAALNSLINAAGINPAPGINAPFKGTFRQEVEPVGGSVYILDMVIDGNELFESLATLETGEQATIPRESLRQSVTIEYIATMPGTIFETTGDQISDDTVRWELALEGEEIITAKSRVTESGSAVLFIISGAGFIIAVILVTVIIEILLMRRKRLRNRLSTAGDFLPQQATIVQSGAWIGRRVDRLIRRPGTPASTPDRIEMSEEGEYRGTHTEGD